MEKQSLIKYYNALFLVLVLLAGFNNAVAQTSSTPTSSTGKQTITAPPVTTQSSEKTNNDMQPLILSILALAASGGAIALTIVKNKENHRDITTLDNKIKSLDKKITDLSNSQLISLSNQQREISNFNPTPSVDSISYLTPIIDRISERISELENKSELAQNSQQSIDYSKNYSYSQSRNIESDFNPFNQTENLSQSNTTQPVENLAYIELVNIYRDNPKLLEQKAIKVSEDKDSIARRHTDSSQKIVLEKANNSNYWVIHDNAGRDCWLLPKSKLRIDQFRYETTKALFECHGYQTEYSTFKLVKPAKVTPLSTDDQTWQLEEPGILEFSVEA